MCWWSAAPPDMPPRWPRKLAAQVTATESDPALAAKARDVLAELGLGNVTCQGRRCRRRRSGRRAL